MNNQHERTMKNGTFLIICSMLIAMAITSCKRDKDPVPAGGPVVNEEEVITGVVLLFVDVDDANMTYSLRYSDPDGDGGNDPVISGDTLPVNRSFFLTTSILNESVSPTVDLSNEIQSEGTDHQLFFAASGVPFNVSYSDVDVNGQPIGLSCVATTGTAGTGTLLVTLRHEPNKSAPDVSSGDITNAGGETDMRVTLPLVVE